jgi:hypothetical protein
MSWPPIPALCTPSNRPYLCSDLLSFLHSQSSLLTIFIPIPSSLISSAVQPAHLRIKMIKVVGPDGSRAALRAGFHLGDSERAYAGANLDPGCQLALSTQIVGIDPQPSGHVATAHVHRRGLGRRHQGLGLPGSTRTMTPPWLLAAMAMLPPMRNARSPSIFISVNSGSLEMSCSMRPASSSS